MPPLLASLKQISAELDSSYCLNHPANNYVANALNEYTSIEAVSPSYDDDGNATAYPLPADVSTNATLVWDAENRLISATLSGGVSYTYEYDYRGRRISKTNSGATTR